MGSGIVIVNEPMLLAGKHRTATEKVGPIIITEKIQDLADKGAIIIITAPKPLRKGVKSGSDGELHPDSDKESGVIRRHSNFDDKSGKGSKGSIFNKSKKDTDISI